MADGSCVQKVDLSLKDLFSQGSVGGGQEYCSGSRVNRKKSPNCDDLRPRTRCEESHSNRPKLDFFDSALLSSTCYDTYI